ncbi:hypothetical protein [Christiangramia sp. SM2212]|uniref:Uncharacterized protein n=1 Tax=Christiangramia sediminicola TaxID=3073267 RepID=A0ABU1ERZ8_9FLAO|nr:hypothetical protein [Christiangramia sp. SM2212]MDR5591151.1 hypothetical protein [Christiangramia sp. SM2212]
MIYNYIDEILQGYTINLDVLRRDTNLYSISMLQHTGSFHSSEFFFGNENSELESVKFNDFLFKAKENNSSLVITPEYSCPWSTVRNLVDNIENLPSQNKLWVLGCESIIPTNVLEFRDAYNGLNNVEVVFNDIVDNAPGGVLLNPCLYIFKANDPNGIEKTIVLIQFKRQHMGAWGNPLEQQKLIPGQHSYILRNSPDSINLVTVICSDAMLFDGRHIYPGAEGQWDIQPYIILSIQMNPQPAHIEFRDFRRNILKVANKDVISLNWSSEGRSSGNPNFFGEYCKSNISLITEHISNTSSIEEKLIDDNHKKGVYYTLIKPNRHCFYLTPKIEFFYLRMRKPILGLAPGPANRRRGPEIKTIYEYDTVLETFIEVEDTSDGYVDFTEDIQIQSESLQDGALNILDRERLIALTSGELSKVKSGSNWYAVNTLKSFISEDTETINRFTVTFDTNGKEYRISQFGKIEALNVNILSDTNLYPDIIASFKDKCNEVMFLNRNGTKYNYNLVSNDDQIATVAFLGHTSKADAKAMLNQLTKLFPEEDLGNKRIVVWYKPSIAADSYDYEATDVPKFTSTEQTNLTSITK